MLTRSRGRSDRLRLFLFFGEFFYRHVIRGHDRSDIFKISAVHFAIFLLLFENVDRLLDGDGRCRDLLIKVDKPRGLLSDVRSCQALIVLAHYLRVVPSAYLHRKVLIDAEVVCK